MTKKTVLSLMVMLMVLSLPAFSLAGKSRHATIPKVALIVASKPVPDKLSGEGIMLDVGEDSAKAEDDTKAERNAGDYFNLGVAHDDAGRHKEAIEAYRQAIKIRPDYAEAHYNLAVSYLLAGDSTAAHSEYKILKGIDSQMADTLYRKAILMALSDKDNKYIMQVGAFRNIEYANAMVEKLKDSYLHAYIEKEDNFNKVRILGFRTKEEIDAVMKDINKKFNVQPFFITAH